MVMDFGVLKQEIMEPLLDHFDHAVILELGDPLLEALEGLDLKTVTMDGPPTAEAMAAHFGKTISAELSGETSIILCSVKVWETPTSFAEFLPEEGSACQTCKNSQ
jgi:6-pyruvoyl-tetrahydropterin synthase